MTYEDGYFCSIREASQCWKSDCQQERWSWGRKGKPKWVTKGCRVAWSKYEQRGEKDASQGGKCRGKLWVQYHPVCARELIWKSKIKIKNKKNNTEQASFISSFFPCELVESLFFRRNCLLLFKARRYSTSYYKLLQLKIKGYLLFYSKAINTLNKLVGHTIS